MSGAQQVSTETAPVSVVIPCFRSGDVIRRALDSVRNQTVHPLEIIIVDDCSNDDTLQLLESLPEEYGEDRVKVIALSENSGPGTARNVGWDIAQGEYVAFLDADDAWHPRKVELQYGWMKDNPDYVLTGHLCKVVEQGHDPVPLPTRVQFEPVDKNRLMLKNFFSTQTVMVANKIPFRFRAGKRYSEDYLLACEICCNGLNVAAAPESLAYLFKEAFGAGGLSGDLWKMEKGELEVYSLLQRGGLISRAAWLCFSFFSLVKFTRRSLVVGFRRLFR